MSANEWPASRTVDSFFTRPFTTRPHLEKVDIVRGGRPMPVLVTLGTHIHRNTIINALKEKEKQYVLQFQASHYDRVSWLAGSVERNKLFCWPCLLFSVEKSVWTCDGYDHHKGLTHAFQKHDRSLNHVSCVASYKTFGLDPTDRPNQRIDEETKRVEQHNAKARTYRDVLHRMIDVVCLLTTQDYPLCGPVDGQRTLNKDNFEDTLTLISKYIPLLKSYLESVEPQTITRIRDDLIEAMVNVAIRSDVDIDRYVSIVLDSTSDQVSMVLRHVTATGDTCERLINSCDDVSDKWPNVLYDHVDKILSEFNVKDKLIAHGYGAMPKTLDVLCTKVRETFPKAPFAHSHSHRLNLVLQKSMYKFKRCRKFFETLNGLARYFYCSRNRMMGLDKSMRKHNAHISPGRWRYTSRLVATVHQYRHELVVYFEEILDDRGDEVDDETTAQAQGFLAALTNFDICFQLAVFATIFDHTDSLCSFLRSKSLDVDWCVQTVADTVSAIKALTCRYDVVWSQILRDTAYSEPPRKMQRNSEKRKESYRTFYHDIIENITLHIENRFSSLESHMYIGLLNPDAFVQHSKKFPEDLFTTLLQTRNTVFDFLRLKNELVILYRLNQFRGKSPSDLLYYLREAGLKASMPELYRLCVFVLASPITCASKEPTFSALRRIRRHTIATRTKTLTNFSMLSIESVLLGKLRNKAGFYEAVAADFAKQEGNNEFTFLTLQDNVEDSALKF